MGYKTRVQLIKRKKSEQYYINFPFPLAAALNFKKGEIVEWEIENKRLIKLIRGKRAKSRSL